MAKKVINAFNSGEVSPNSHARFDTELYNRACIKLENFIPMQVGGVERRPAGKFLSELGNVKNVMYPFVFNNSNTYNLIFQPTTLLVYADYDLIATLTTPYLESELYELKMIQSADIVFITHPNHPVKQLKRTSENQFSFSDFEYKFPPLIDESENTLSITDVTTDAHKTAGERINLTANENIFKPVYLGTQFLIKQLRDKTNSVYVNNSVTASFIGDAVNASFSNWEFSTNGTGKGKITILRSLDGGINYEEYVQIGDTTGGTTKNFSFASTEPEPANSLLKVRFSYSASGYDFELKVADPYAYGLVTIESTTGTDSAPSNTCVAVVNSPLLYSSDSFTKVWQASVSSFASAGDFFIKTGNFVTTADSNLSSIAITGATDSTTATLTKSDGAHGLTVNDTITVANASDGTYNGTFKIQSVGDSGGHTGNTLTYTLPTNPTSAAPSSETAGKQKLVQLTTTSEIDSSGTQSLNHVKDVAEFQIGSSNYIVTLSQKGFNDGAKISGNQVSDTPSFLDFYEITNTGATSLSFNYKGHIDLSDGTDTNDSTALGIEYYENHFYILFAKRSDQTSIASTKQISFKKYTVPTDISSPSISYVSAVTHTPPTGNNNSASDIFLYGDGSTTLSDRVTTALGAGFDGSNYFMHFAYLYHVPLRYGVALYYQALRYYPSTGAISAFDNEFKYNGSSIHSFGSATLQGLVNSYSISGWYNGSEHGYSDFKGLHDYVDTKKFDTGSLLALNNIDKVLEKRNSDSSFSLITAEPTIPLPNLDWAGYTRNQTSGKMICVTTDGKFIEMAGAGATEYYQALVDFDSSAAFATDFNAGKMQQLDPFGFEFQELAFSDRLGYPHSVSIFENRLCFGGTDTSPNTLWLSKTNDLDNFQTGTEANASMRLSINSNTIDEIEWLCSASNLVIGTTSNEWTLGAGSDQLAITPTQFNIRRRSSYGSNNIQAMLVNASVIFTMRQGEKIREWIDQNTTNVFLASDLTAIADHITSGGMLQFAVQTQPETIIWSVRNDGTLLGLTYEKESDTFAWHRHSFKDTDGLTATVESVSVLPTRNGEDCVYVIIKRASDRVYLKLDSRNWGTTYTSQYSGLDQYAEYASFTGSTLGSHTVSSLVSDATNNYVTVTTAQKHNLSVGDGVTIAGASTSPVDPNGTHTVHEIVSDIEFRFLLEVSSGTTTHTGTITCTDLKLKHFANQSVTYKVDGVTGTGTVDASNYTLAIGAQTNKSVYVGVPYTSTLAPLYIQSQATLGSKKPVQKATIRFKDTVSAKAGQTETTTDPVIFEGNSALYTEDVEVWLSNANEFLQTIYVVQDEPQPCTVLAMIANVEKI
jgi:hypothetical protein